VPLCRCPEGRRFAVTVACAAAGVSTSAYYAWAATRDAPPTATGQAEARLRAGIRRLHTASGGADGVRRITQRLRRDGWTVNRKRVARVTRDVGLAGYRPRRRRSTTMLEPATPERQSGRSVVRPRPAGEECGDGWQRGGRAAPRPSRGWRRQRAPVGAAPRAREAHAVSHSADHCDHPGQGQCLDEVLTSASSLVRHADGGARDYRAESQRVAKPILPSRCALVTSRSGSMGDGVDEVDAWPLRSTDCSVRAWEVRRRGSSGAPAPSSTGCTPRWISSSRPASTNAPTSSPPPTSQMSLSPATARIWACTGATSPWTKRMSMPGIAGRSRWVKAHAGTLPYQSRHVSVPPTRSSWARIPLVGGGAHREPADAGEEGRELVAAAAVPRHLEHPVE